VTRFFPFCRLAADIPGSIGAYFVDRIEQLRESLAYRGLTLHSVSQNTAELFGRYSPFYIPHNWYRRLARSQSIVTVHQVFALSRLTNFRFSDWLTVFGYDLDPIFTLQLRMPRKWTAILDSTIHATQDWVPWFVERDFTRTVPAIAPLGVIVKWAGTRRAADLLALNKREFLYAVIGRRDVYALPHFVPGSIVRVDKERAKDGLWRDQSGRDGHFFLVEHNRGWTCTRLCALADNRVLLHCPQQPCAERELQIGTNVRILGAVDAEIRPGAQQPPIHLTRETQASGKVRPEEFLCEPTGFGNLLVKSRTSAGLSFRDASAISRAIANSLSNKHYFIAPGTLSDYETLREPPRHIPKIITLSLIYAIRFDRLLQLSGLPLDSVGEEPMPDGIIGRQTPAANRASRNAVQNIALNGEGFLKSLIAEWEEVPFFLRFALDEITGLKDFSLSDVFWVGGDKSQLHPLLKNAAFVAVNRRAKKPDSPGDDGICQEHLYLILRRDGTHVCGPCTLDGSSLTVHGYPRGHVPSHNFRDGIDAEVVGQVTAILRRIG